MNEYDNQLRELALEAQQHPMNSRERRKILTSLIRTINHSGQLVRPRQDQFQGVYEEIYDDAVQRLFTYLCYRIDNYNSDKGEVLQWANFLLRQRFFIEASREFMTTVYKGMDARSVVCLTLDDLDRENPSDVDPSASPLLSKEVRTCIDDDPDGEFQAAHIKKRPDASFRLIALRRIDGFSWQDIAEELNLQIPTLSTFYQRQLTKFAPKLKEYLS